jgi:hypothetical protein
MIGFHSSRKEVSLQEMDIYDTDNNSYIFINIRSFNGLWLVLYPLNLS